MKPFYKKRHIPFAVKKISIDNVIKRKSRSSETYQLCKSIAAEITGLAPYEKKAVDYIKNDNIQKAKKFLKIRLGSLPRAEKRLELLMKLARQ